MKRKLLILSLLLMALGLVACASPDATAPRAWIDYPADGKHLAVGQPITVISHAYAPAGAGELLLYVNGHAYSRDAFSGDSKNFDTVRQEWTPTEAGKYILQVFPYDTEGVRGQSDAVAVVVGETVAEATPAATAIPPTPTPISTPTPTPAPTNTPSPEPTATATSTPSPTPTNTPPPPTNTPIPPTNTPIPPTNTPIPPTNTPVPTNTPAPTPTPPDTSPPPAPKPMVPADGLALSCRAKQTLVWMPVSDPSGIAGYYVTLEWEIKAGQWKHVKDWGPIQGKQLEIPVDCGLHYRWRVRAQDGAGNMGAWSKPSYFSINID